jgi:pilus assembly protein CpaC
MKSNSNNNLKPKRSRYMAKALVVIGGLSLVALAAAPAKVVVAQSAPASRPADGIVADGLSNDGSLKLAVNKTAVITTRVKVKQISVGEAEVAAVNPIGPTAVLVTGKKMGTTQLIIWDDDNRTQTIDVTVDFDLQAMQEQIKKLFPQAHVEISAMNGAILLNGRVPDLKSAEQIVALASPYSQKVMNLLEVSGGQQIQLQVRFAEVSRGAITNLGVRTTLIGPGETFTFNNGPGSSLNGGLATGQNVTVDPNVTVAGAAHIGDWAFEAFISAMKTNNLLRVLAEPNLVAISGQEASFLAGGEIPVPVPQATGGGTTITIEYKQFGVRLSFVPIVLGDGRVRLKVSPEVSDLDFSNAVTLSGTQIPALSKRNVTTTVELRDGQTFAIAGLLNDRVQANHSSTPYLSDLPVLGALFRSVRYERRETELLVLVTPKIVSPMDPGQVTQLPGEKWRHPNENELFWFRDLGGPQQDAGKPESAGPTTMASGTPARFRGQYGLAAPAEEQASADEP